APEQRVEGGELAAPEGLDLDVGGFGHRQVDLERERLDLLAELRDLLPALLQLDPGGVVLLDDRLQLAPGLVDLRFDLLWSGISVGRGRQHEGTERRGGDGDDGHRARYDPTGQPAGVAPTYPPGMSCHGDRHPFFPDRLPG